jgi:hypothetical protein
VRFRWERWRWRKTPPHPPERVAFLVDDYEEGRRLMRFGDGADELIGNAIAFKAREELRSMGYDETGGPL